MPLHRVRALSGLVSLVHSQGASTTAEADPSFVPVERWLLSPLREVSSGVGRTERPLGRGTSQLRMEKRPGGASLSARNRAGVMGLPMRSAAARPSSCRREPKCCLRAADARGCLTGRRLLRDTRAAPLVPRDALWWMRPVRSARSSFCCCALTIYHAVLLPVACLMGMYAIFSHCIRCSDVACHALFRFLDTTRRQMWPNSGVRWPLLYPISPPTWPPTHTRCRVNGIGLDRASRHSWRRDAHHSTNERRRRTDQKHRRGEETRPTAAQTVGEEAPTRNKDDGSRRANPQHRREEETRVPEIQKGGRDAPNGGADDRRTRAHVWQWRWEEMRPPATQTGGGDARTRNMYGGKRRAHGRQKRVDGWLANSSRDKWTRGAHQQHRGGEEWRRPRTRPWAVRDKGSVDKIGISASATSVSSYSRRREGPRVQSTMGDEDRVRRSPTWGRPSTLIGDCGSTPQKETKTAITCARWRWFECYRRLKIFQRSTNVFHSMWNIYSEYVRDRHVNLSNGLCVNQRNAKTIDQTLGTSKRS